MLCVQLNNGKWKADLSSHDDGNEMMLKSSFLIFYVHKLPGIKGLGIQQQTVVVVPKKSCSRGAYLVPCLL